MLSSAALYCHNRDMAAKPKTSKYTALYECMSKKIKFVRVLDWDQSGGKHRDAYAHTTLDRCSSIVKTLRDCTRC